ncbi:MAG: membrane dipeptidase, partial [Bacteroidota bacterium]|nr:membrane dipeptidase [Bacteroidota bacterium]
CLLDDYIKEPDTTSVKFQEMKKLRKIYRTTFNQMNEKEKEAFSRKWEEVQGMNSADMPSVKNLVDHIDHVKNLVGVDFVGIGSDFDGGGGLLDCADVSQFPNITLELVRRGYSEKEIRKIWGGNLLRVFRDVEKVAEKGN